MSDDSCTDCDYTGCETNPTPHPAEDPMESMRIGDLRLMVDYVAHTNAYRRFEARVLQAELDPVGAANARYGGSGQRRSLPILDPIDDPAHGPMPVHPADLEPFVQQEVLFDRGPRETDEPRVTEETFPQLEALGLEAPEVPLEPPTSFGRPLPGGPPVAEQGGIADVSLDLTCPKPEQTSDETAIATEFSIPAPAPLDSHRVFVPEGTPQRNLVVLLHGAGGSAQSQSVETLATHFARAGFRTVALSWNLAELTARTTCLARMDFEPVADPVSASPDLRDWQDATIFDDAILNDCLEAEREAKAHDPTHGVAALLVDALIAMLDRDPAGQWEQFLTFGFLPGNPRRPFVPAWSRIVQAGYSEGANQTAYMLRAHPLFGAVLVSGGGDLGVVDYPRYASPPLANWMYPELPSNQNLVGLWDEGEQFEYQRGWTSSGMPRATADAEVPGPYYGSFSGGSRLRNVCSCPRPHGSTVQGSLYPAHMYLACKAGT